MIDGFLLGEPRLVRRVRSWIERASQPFVRVLGADAEDLTQEVLLGLTVALREGRFRGDSSFETYVRTFAHYRCIDRRRVDSRRQMVGLEELGVREIEEPRVLDDLSRAEEASLAMRVVGEMSESCRELWQMVLAGQSYRQMSERLGVSEGALRVRVARCRKRAVELRERLQRSTLGESAEGGRDRL